MSEIQKLNKIITLEKELVKWKRLHFETEKETKIGSYKINFETLQAEWSDGLRDIFNFSASEKLPNANEFYQFVHPDDVEMVKAMFDNCIKKGNPFDLEYRIVLPGDIQKFVHSRGTVKPNNEGDRCLFGYFKDITEHKKQDLEFKNYLNSKKIRAGSDHKYLKLRFQAELWNNIGQAVITTNAVGEIVYLNPAAEKLFGWKEEEVLGQYPNSVFTSPDMDARGAEIMKTLLRGKSWRGEFLVKNREGKSFWAEVLDTPILDEDGKLIGIIGISSDITERVTLKDELKVSEKKYRSLVENSPMGIVILEQDCILFANTFFAELCGVPSENLINKSLFDFLVEEDKQIFEKYLEHFNRVTEHFPTKMAFRFKSPDKSLKNIEATLTNVREESGNKKVQMVLIDVTHFVELKNKTKTLLTDSVYMSRKLQRFDGIKAKLESIVSKNKCDETKFVPLLQMLDEERNLEQLWEIFQHNFEMLHKDFFKKLMQKAPTLTQQEIKHCAYIKLGFETKEIANMFNVKPTSIQIGRVRIKKKLQLNSEQELTSYIHLL